MTGKDYESKINSQVKQIEMSERELEELRRINSNKISDNEGLRLKSMSNKDLLKNNEHEYLSVREQNEEIIWKNKALKDEIVQLEDRLREERQRQVELRAVKDKVSHQIYKGTDELGDLRVKEEELIRRLKEKEYDQ